MLRGIYTAAAAEQLRTAGVDLGVVATVDLEQLARIEGNDGRVTSVVARTARRRSAMRWSSLQPTRHRATCWRAWWQTLTSRTVGPAAAAFELPPSSDGRDRVPVLEGDRRRPADGVGQGIPAPRVGQAGFAVRYRHMPGQRVHATPAGVRLRQVGPAGGAVHGATGVAPADHQRGRRRHASRPVPANRAARRARRARRAHGSLRRMVATVELRQLPRRVLGGARGRVVGRCFDARAR